MGCVEDIIITMMEEVDMGLEGLRRTIHHLVAYFYANNVLIGSMWEGQLQQDFGALMDLFDHVFFSTNFCKMVSMF